jgi:hypothetical protein
VLYTINFETFQKEWEKTWDVSGDGKRKRHNNIGNLVEWVVCCKFLITPIISAIILQYCKRYGTGKRMGM